jgi:hypothetical protein
MANMEMRNRAPLEVARPKDSGEKNKEPKLSEANLPKRENFQKEIEQTRRVEGLKGK